MPHCFCWATFVNTLLRLMLSKSDIRPGSDTFVFANSCIAAMNPWCCWALFAMFFKYCSTPP
eukprot:3307382-Prorocentrum_lima.AAC.1